MRSMRHKLIALVPLLVVARTAAAQHAEHAEHAANWSLLAFHAFGLAVLIGLVVYFARAPLKTFLQDRSDGLRRQLESARVSLERARAANAELRARLGRISEENDALVREAADLAERERARAIERAQSAADRIRAEARRAADQEIERARAELQREAARLATSLAGDMVRQSLTPDDERRMIAEFVERLGRPT